MNIAPRPTNRVHRRSGAAAVEFAIVLPVMITIVFGCVDLGRFFHTRYSVTNAARAGAGWAVLNSDPTASTTWQAEVRQQVVDEMDQLRGFDNTQLEVTTTLDFSDGAVPVIRVTAQYPFSMVVSWPLLPQSFQLYQAAEMRAVR